MKPKQNGLTLKQGLFAEAYLGAARGNGLQAARIAGYRGTDATLRAVASENLTKANIASYVQKRVDDVAMSADEVLRELARIARMDSEHLLRAKQLKDKVRALELLGRHHKLFVDRVETTLSEQEMAAAIEEAFEHEVERRVRSVRESVISAP